MLANFTPINPTGYSDDNSDVWQVEPGWEVSCHISPDALSVVRSISKENDVNISKVIGGLIYTHLEFLDDDIRQQFLGGVIPKVNAWLTPYETHPLSMFLVAHSDDFVLFLLHESEADKVSYVMTQGGSEINLGWTNIVLEE